jgi:hypothetical protein
MSSTPIPLEQVEVAVHTSSEDYPPAKTRQCASHSSYSANSRLHDTPPVMGIGSDLENGVQEDEAL